MDGFEAAIAELIRTGVPQPMRHPAPRPPLGGAKLDSVEIAALAALVHSLSTPPAAPKP